MRPFQSTKVSGYNDQAAAYQQWKEITVSTPIAQPQGNVGAQIVETTIVDFNLQAWTVDVRTQFDQKIYLDIQVSAPYLHWNNGEGIYALPEVGAKCVICLPSDSTPPFVLAFVMPSLDQQNEFLDTDVSEEGGVSKDVSAVSYVGNRARPKVGDIVLKGRDGNFVILHRGGVLQIGSSELAQRIYIPLNNVITDISQNYKHYNTGGAINWGVSSLPSEDNPPTFYKQTFRLFANEGSDDNPPISSATIRVAIGTFSDIVKEPSVDDGGQDSNLNQLNIGTDDDEPIVCEIVLSPSGFVADTGGLTKDATENTTLRFFFDKKGSTFLRCKGSILLTTDEKFKVVAPKGMEFESEESIVFRAKTFVITGPDLCEIGGKLTKINGGTKPVATVGSAVSMTVIAPIPIVTSAGPGTILSGAVFSGVITSGNPTILC